MRRCVVAALASCHAAAPPPTVPPPPLDPPAKVEPRPPATADLGAGDACARFDALAGQGCSWTQRFPPAMRDTAMCVGSLTTWLAPETRERDKMQRIVNCWARDCDGAEACMVQIAATAPPPASRNCGEEGIAPIAVDDATWSARRGASAKRFADETTSEAAPIEVCGIEDELAWMTRVTCNDGKNPYGSLATANDSRDPWVGRGGRCNSVLDRYSVRCPEATYTVYVDRYICPIKR